MTIREAFKKHQWIDVTYVERTSCPRCYTALGAVEDEISFEGNEEDFNEYTRTCGVLKLDDKIEPISEYHYNFFYFSPDKELCPRCRAIELYGFYGCDR